MKHHMKTKRRRGTVYIAVLAVATIVVIIGVTGIALARAQKRAVDAQSEAAEARFYALAGIQIGRVWIAQNSNWRTAYTSSLFASQTVGSGTYSLTMTNATGAVTLDNTPSDPVTLVSTGAKGRARQIISVTMIPVPSPSSCLSAALVSNGALSFSSATILPANQAAASNTSISASSSLIYSDVQTAGSYSGSNYYGQTTSGTAALTMPDSTVWSYYQTYGTVIPSATMSSNNWRLRRLVLSPTTNPISGTTNTRGIYIIDCQNNTFTIDTCRIVGTLVLLNASNGVYISNSNNMTPAVSNLPALMVQGTAFFQMSTSALAEGGSVGNLNPPGTPYPYPSGTSNTNTTDTYPSIIDGLVYVSGNVTVWNACSIDMLVIGGTANVGASITLNYNASLLTNPPPGFGTISMTAQSGTFTQNVN